MFSNSPLFQRATREIQEAARSAFERTNLGRLVTESQRAVEESRRAGTRLPYQLNRAMETYERRGWRAALRAMGGTRLGDLATQIERYGKGPLRGILSKFLGELGPAGVLLKALVGYGGATLKDELEVMATILRQMGYDVRPPAGGEYGRPSIEAAGELLNAVGLAEASPFDTPEVQAADRARRADRERAEGRRPQEPREAGPSGEVPVAMAGGGFANYPPDHPIVTGDMLPAPGSSNVHSFGYDASTAYLYVRFLGYTDKHNADGRRGRGGPGSLYRYANVTPEEFLGLMQVSSKGDWVWDNLRIRGTWSGHQKDYELVGVEGGYVPRKATVRLNRQTGQIEEWLIKRRVRTDRGEWLTSSLDEQLAGPMPWGQPDRGTPSRGDSAAPDTGRP